MIQHISFDLWLTLIKSHPQFKMRRAELIASDYSDKALTAVEIDALIRKIDKQIDQTNEATGTKMPAVDMFQSILEETLFSSNNIDEYADRLKRESDKLFLEYLPHLLNENIIETLQSLKDEGYTLNLASNTGFIEGETLRKALLELGLYRFFDFLVFSDEVKASKPSAIFFEAVCDKAEIIPQNILHIGDNKFTDYEGAINYGMQAYLITNTNYSIDDIKREL